MNQITIPTIIRRGIAILSLCALTATITATWLSASNAAAAPGLSQLADARDEAVRAQKSAPTPAAEDDGDDEPRSRGKSLRGKLNLNTASGEQLEMLPGVGPAKSERILEYRQKNGKFRRVQDLRRVKGFGYKTLQKLAPYLAVDGENTLTVE
jgi:competence protein ComEA